MNKTLESILTNKIFMVVIALIVLSVVLYFMFFSKKIKEEQDAAQLQDDINDSAQVPTYSETQYNAFADVIYNSLNNSSISDNKDDAIAILNKMEQTVDVLKLIKAYGTRQRYIFGINDGEKTTLPQTIIDEISEPKREKVNQKYKSLAIKFQW